MVYSNYGIYIPSELFSLFSKKIMKIILMLCKYHSLNRNNLLTLTFNISVYF